VLGFEMDDVIAGEQPKRAETAIGN